MADKIFPKGLKFFNKLQSHPDFVLGTMVITIEDLQAFCTEQSAHATDYNGKKQLRFQLKKSQEGNMYAELDTWKKQDANSNGQTQRAVKETTNYAHGAIGSRKEDNSDLPF